MFTNVSPYSVCCPTRIDAIKRPSFQAAAKRKSIKDLFLLNRIFSASVSGADGARNKLASARKYCKLIGVWIPILVFSLLGCQRPGSEQMAAVSKDWCLSIRANQVIPVYPLTEDLVPGDVFLVQLSIAQQQKAFEESGFLSLDDHRYRIPLTEQESGFAGLYFDGYFKDEFGSPIPHARIFRMVPKESAPAEQPALPILPELPAPRVAFPSYSFSIEKNLGLSSAIPVQSIPIGFNYMRSQKATGTVTLLDAHTYAADTYFLEQRLRTWAKREIIHKSLTDAVEMNNGRPVFLRVVSRVFLVGGVAVSLTNSDANGVNIAAGSAVANPPAKDETDLQMLNQLAAQTNGAYAVGASVRFLYASNLTVSMNEIFDQPLVIGYWGFDVAVDQHGVLGPRVPTFAVLTNLKQPIPAIFGDFTDHEQKNALLLPKFDALALKPGGASLQLRFIIDIAGQLADSDPSFRQLAEGAQKLGQAQPGTAEHAAQVQSVIKQFRGEVIVYESAGGRSGPQYEKLNAAFVNALGSLGVEP